MGKRPKPFDLSGPQAAGADNDDFDLNPEAAAESDRPDLAAPPPPEADPSAPTAAPAPTPVVKATAKPPSSTAPGPRAAPVYLAAFLLSAAWVAVPILLATEPSARAGLPVDDLSLVLLALLGAGPVILVWIAAYLVQQGRALAAEGARARALAQSLLEPAAIAAQGAGGIIENLRVEIDGAAQAAAKAQSDLLTLRESLSAESERLMDAAERSNKASADLADGLAAEREKIEKLAASLDERGAKVAESITGHAKLVAEASDLAETQIREAQVALAARAADLAAAAGDAGEAAKLAAESVGHQVGLLETATQSVGEQTRTIEDSLAEQRAALVAAAHSMQADHEAHAVAAESLRAKLAEAAGQAREGAAEIGETATRGADVVRQMISAADEQLREVIRLVGDERDKLSAEATKSIAAVAELADREREAIEARATESIGLLAASAAQARQTAEAHVTSARAVVDQLGETAFAAGQQAFSVFESRLSEARKIIEQSSQIVDDAGAKSAERLNKAVEAARGALTAFESVIADIDQRMARAPADAEAQALAIRQNVERSIEALMGSARKAAEETQTIDAAFQDRVRRNYDMLSEAVRLMGVVAGAAGAAPGVRNATRAAAPIQPPQPLDLPPPAPTATEASAPAAPPTDAPAAPEAGAAARSGLRPRLKLTPTATEDEFKNVFEAAGGRDSTDGGSESWTWKELLSSMDQNPTEDAALPGAMLGEIEAMGIDAAALVPRSRIDEIAEALKSGQRTGGRDLVRRLAPAAVRRLARRLVGDREFRAQAERYLRRYEALLADAAKREGEAGAAAALLASDQGRAFLLLDAAIIDAA